MATINFARREIEAKLVYCGPALSGKTTNVHVLHGLVPNAQRSKLHTLATDQERTLFFDYVPLELGQIAGFKARFKLFTVPGQAFYRETRRVVLAGADGVVFVADSAAERAQHNLDALVDLEEHLNAHGTALLSIPLVLQLNKRDLPNAMSVATMTAELNPFDVPVIEAVARTGQGVLDTLYTVTSIASRRIRDSLAGRETSMVLTTLDRPEAEDDRMVVLETLEKITAVRPVEEARSERMRTVARLRPDDIAPDLLEEDEHIVPSFDLPPPEPAEPEAELEDDVGLPPDFETEEHPLPDALADDAPPAAEEAPAEEAPAEEPTPAAAEEPPAEEPPTVEAPAEEPPAEAPPPAAEEAPAPPPAPEEAPAPKGKRKRKGTKAAREAEAAAARAAEGAAREAEAAAARAAEEAAAARAAEEAAREAEAAAARAAEQAELRAAEEAALAAEESALPAEPEAAPDAEPDDRPAPDPTTDEGELGPDPDEWTPPNPMPPLVRPLPAEEPEAADDPVEERTPFEPLAAAPPPAPAPEPRIPIGRPIEARVGLDALAGARATEARSLVHREDGVPGVEIVVQREGAQVRHTVWLLPEEPAPPPPGWARPFVVGLGGFALGAVVGLLVGWLAFAAA